MKWQQRTVATLAVGYAVAFVIWRLLEASPRFSAWWPLQISEIFAVWVLLPLPFLVVAALRWRTHWVLVALLIPILWFGREYGGVILPTASAVARANTEGTSLRVMTFNMQALSGDSQQFLASVDEWQPDIFVLQEANSSFVARLRRETSSWPNSKVAPVRGYGRVAIFSKLPILSIESDNEMLGCHCAQALVDWHGKSIRVIVVHIRAPTFGPRRPGKLPAVYLFDDSKQAITYSALLPEIAESREPLIVLGDFNTTERQQGYKLLYDAGLKDAHEQAGWGLGLTYPAPFSRTKWLPISLIRIDHIFYDDSWRATWTQTSPLMGSDHQALLADLQWIGHQ